MVVTISPRSATTAEQFLIIHVGAERYGVPIASIATIAAGSTVVIGEATALEGACGVLPWRKWRLPMFDIRTRSAPAPDRARAPALLFHSEDVPIGVIVDRLEGIVSPLPETREPIPDWADNTVFSGIVRDSRGMILLVDPVALVTKIIACSGNWKLDHGSTHGQDGAPHASAVALRPSAVRSTAAPDQGQNNGLRPVTMPARLLVCRQATALGERQVALDADVVVNVVNIEALHPLPDAPATMLGLYLWHGRAVPVLNLPGLLGGQPAPGTQPRLLLCRVASAQASSAERGGLLTIGVPVDAVARISGTPTGTTLHAHDLPFGSDVVKGQFALSGETVYLLDEVACADAMR